MELKLTESSIKRLWLNEDFKILMSELSDIKQRHNEMILNVQLSDVDYAYNRGAVNVLGEVIHIIDSYEE